MSDNRSQSNGSRLFGPVEGIALIIGSIAIGLIAFFFLGDRLQQSQSFTGHWSSTDGQILEIQADREAVGDDGCNLQSSSWMLTESAIDFEGFRGTERGCLDAQGELIQGWLGKSVSASFDSERPGELIFYGADGEELGSMVRNPEPFESSEPRTDESADAPVDDGGQTADPQPTLIDGGKPVLPKQSPKP